MEWVELHLTSSNGHDRFRLPIEIISNSLQQIVFKSVWFDYFRSQLSEKQSECEIIYYTDGMASSNGAFINGIGCAFDDSFIGVISTVDRQDANVEVRMDKVEAPKAERNRTAAQKILEAVGL